MSVLGQLISRIPGLDDYNDQVKQNAALTGQNIQQGAQFMTLQGAMQEQAAKRAALEREAGYRARLATAKTDEERAQIAMEAAGPTGVLTHLDKVSRDKATAEQAQSRLTQAATQFRETKRLRQAEIDRMTNNDAKRDAQRVLDNEAKAFELQIRGEAARRAGALGADTIMGFEPRPVPAVPTMQNPTGATPPPAGIVTGEAPDQASAVRAINAGSGRPMSVEIPAQSPAASVVSAAQPQATSDAWAPPAPVVSAASPNNLDARDLGAGARGPVLPAPVVPVPGQGVPGVRARAEQPPMPNFTGSPREVRKAQNDWKDDMAKAAMKEDAKNAKIGINLAGGRESVFINRVVNSGNQAAADLENVVKLPITASRGIFGGRSQGKSLLDAGQETLANKMTTQDVQTYNVFATGFQRALAAIEGAGLAPSNALMHQMDQVIFKEGDTNFTKLVKLAQTRQIVEKGLETITANSRVDAETKKLVGSIVEKIQKAVPFTGSELIELQGLQATDPNATLKDVMAANKKAATGGWSIRPK